MFEEFNGKYIVIGVSGLIGFLFITVQLGVIYPIITEWSFIEKVKVLGPINIGAFLLSYNYYLAIITDPGRVPDGWEPPYSLIHEPEQVQINNGETGPRYCRTCEAYKPPRAHHCRVCKRCVLKMDHHCPWINNCVGYGNYPHFFRFVFFVNLTCGYALILLLWRIYLILDTNNIVNLMQPIKLSEMILLIIDFVATFLVVFCVGILGFYHTYCLLKGQTTIEGSERSKVRRLIRRRKIMPVEFPFDLGVSKNITSVLGSNPLLWLLPQPVIGDGLTFPIKPNTDPRLPYYWPPRDPDDLRPSIFDIQEQNNRQNNQRVPPQLVRRDSEGYLVREISYEERMQMLNYNYHDDDYYDQYQQHQQEQHIEEDDYLVNNTEHENNNISNTEGGTYNVKPSNYFYDSGSETDQDYMDEEEDDDSYYGNEYNDQNENQWEDLENDHYKNNNS